MCMFCEIFKNQKFVVYENAFVFAILDEYPVSKGHVLIIPKRHVKDYFELSIEEKQAIDESIAWLKERLDSMYHPDGYNIGINNGEAAGQTVMHAHVHLIPRYHGDMKDPRGGIRGVIPEKQKY